MSKPQFVYVIYIRTTQEKLWAALTDSETNKKFWLGAFQVSTFEKGAPWKIMFPDGRVADSGEILEADQPKRLVIRWRNEFMPELKAEGYSTCTMELETVGHTVKLTVIHEFTNPESQFLKGVSQGWPGVLSSLKSLLETGEPLDTGQKLPTKKD